MTKAEYVHFTEPKIMERKVKSLVPLANGYGKLPAGKIYTITRKYKGYNLTSDPCKCCGFQQKISRVKWYDVQLISEF